MGDIEKIIKNTFRIEIEALTHVADSVSITYIKAIDTIFNASGRVVVTGIGKSAIIAQKIAATLNSTGTPSIFMHAGDAVHGDLGIVTNDDVVLYLSRSGETNELYTIVPYLSEIGCKTIAIVSNSESYLAMNVDHCILIPINREADPNNLAPTASTTVQMAVGDALAMALAYKQGFTATDFAKLHPGGSLGRRLNTDVDSIIKGNKRPVVGPEDSINDTIIQVSSGRLGAAAVVGNGSLIGIVTDGDIRRMLEGRKKLELLKARDIMSVNPKTIQSSSSLDSALHIMKENSITQLIVVDHHKNYIGILHLHDILKEGIY